jgi:hypothetical protein
MALIQGFGECIRNPGPHPDHGVFRDVKPRLRPLS